MKRYAILIANGRFPEHPGLGSLETPVRDLVDLRNRLTQLHDGGFQVLDLPDKAAGEILDTVESILNNAEPDDLVLIHFSGHGLLNEERTKLSLATRDTKPTRPPHREIPFEHLSTIIKSSNKTRVVILLDCCYSGAAGREFRSVSDLPDALLNEDGFSFMPLLESRGASISTTRSDPEAGRGVYVLTACSARQHASGEISGNGLFTKQVLEALDKARPIDRPGVALTIHSLYRSVHDGLSQSGQTPMLFCRGGQATPDMLLLPAALPYSPGTLGIDSTPITWTPLTDREILALNQVVPAYLLDSRFFFKDWNVAFQSLFANRLKLSRRDHASVFLAELNNAGAVVDRANRVFVKPDPNSDEQKRCDATGEIPATFPRVDFEPFDYNSEYGFIRLQKVATQIREPKGRPRTWCCTLNVDFAERHDELWAHLKELSVQEDHWNRYAECYDDIIGAYPHYQDLVQFVVSKVDGAINCLDIGAGTGNTTLALHRRAAALGLSERNVTAVDSSEGMLHELSKKLKPEQGFSARTTVVKDDALAWLNRSYTMNKRQEKDPERFDCCVMLNSLFVLNKPIECLKAIRKILKPGGALVFSTPRAGTDVHELFRKIREYFESLGAEEWSRRQPAWEMGYERNKSMVAEATRDTLRDIRGYCTRAGFEIESEDDGQYDECVVVIKAVKPKTRTGRRVRVPKVED